MLEELCKRIQYCCTTLRRSRNKRNVGSCWLKNLTGFKLCATTSNNMQQGVQTDVTCNIQQCWELLANNVGSFCTGLKTQSSSKKKPFKHPRVQWRKLSNYLGMTSTVLLVLKRGQLITIRFENFFIVMINSKMRRRVGCVLE